MPFQVKQVFCLSIFRKLLLHLGIIANVEWNVYSRAVFGVYVVAVETFCRIHVIVKDPRLLLCLFFVNLNTTLGKHVLEV